MMKGREIARYARRLQHVSGVRSAGNADGHRSNYTRKAAKAGIKWHRLAEGVVSWVRVDTPENRFYDYSIDSFRICRFMFQSRGNTDTSRTAEPSMFRLRKQMNVVMLNKHMCAPSSPSYKQNSAIVQTISRRKLIYMGLIISRADWPCIPATFALQPLPWLAFWSAASGAILLSEKQFRGTS